MFLVFVIGFALQCASATITLECTYSSAYNWAAVGFVYTCDSIINRFGQTTNVVGVSQNHQSGMTDQDVKALTIRSQQIDFIPEDINLHFAHLEVIVIASCPIKSLTKDDLKAFPKLKYIGIYTGELRTLKGDVFMYSTELEFVNLNSHQITNIGPGIFQHSPKLTTAHFSNNLCVNNFVSNNATAVDIFVRELSFKCPPTVKMIEEIILEGDNFLQAVSIQVEKEITVIDDRVKQLEEGSEILSNNYLEVMERTQQLEEGSEILSNNYLAVMERTQKLEEGSEILSNYLAAVMERTQKLEEGSEILSSNLAAVMERTQQLEEDYEALVIEHAATVEQLKIRIGTLERIICNNQGICV